MTQEEKDLLFKDLCARLPYGVKVKYLYWDENKNCEYPIAMVLDSINSDGYIKFHGDIAEGEAGGTLTQNLPYLRPMSSMTEEEKREVGELGVSDDGAFHNDVYDVGTSMEEAFTAISWFLERHFDVNYLIQRGLALEAPEGMYKND